MPPSKSTPRRVRKKVIRPVVHIPLEMQTANLPDEEKALVFYP